MALEYIPTQLDTASREKQNVKYFQCDVLLENVGKLISEPMQDPVFLRLHNFLRIHDNLVSHENENSLSQNMKQDSRLH